MNSIRMIHVTENGNTPIIILNDRSIDDCLAYIRNLGFKVVRWSMRDSDLYFTTGSLLD